MRAAVFDEFGGPQVLRIENVPVPEPGTGEVLVRVRAASLNHLDLWVRRGIPIETTMPHIGGSDIAGEVASETNSGADAGAGPGAGRIGSRVVVNPSLSCGVCEFCGRGEEPLCVRYRIIGEHVDGGFAEYVAVPAGRLLEIPDHMSFEEAAAAPLVFLTAWRGLVSRGRLAAGESVLITGASGGVASAAVQIARHVGARVYAVTTGDNVERVRQLGADVVYDRADEDYAKQLWQDTGKRGVDVVFDSVGEAQWAQNLRSLARGGRLVVYGATTGHKAELDLRVVFWKQIEIIGTTMANQGEFEAVMRLVFDGTLKPVIDRVFALDQIQAAHERLERGAQFGKIVIVP
jgi:NADPH:quinone reductase-like Zn-dependent oxidoreductase